MPNTKKLADTPSLTSLPCLITGKKITQRQNPCKCKSCLTNDIARRHYDSVYQKVSKDKINANHRVRQARLRRIVLEHYSGIPPKCQCCGNPIYDFLTIDQIGAKGGWKLHRKLGAENFCMQIIKQGFPLTYRVLCYNCNCSFGFYGYCPHERARVNGLS